MAGQLVGRQLADLGQIELAHRDSGLLHPAVPGGEIFEEQGIAPAQEGDHALDQLVAGVFAEQFTVGPNAAGDQHLAPLGPVNLHEARLGGHELVGQRLGIELEPQGDYPHFGHRIVAVLDDGLDEGGG